MVRNKIRSALKNLRSGVDREMAIEELVESGRSAVRALATELELQSNSSLFTGTLLTILGRIAADNPRSIDATTLNRVYKQIQQFVPLSVIGGDRNRWIEKNLGVLGIQVLRARYRFSDDDVRAVEDTIRVSVGAKGDPFPSLADVLDGDLDANLQLKAAYVRHIVEFFEDVVGRGERDLACTTAHILGCFGPVAGRAVSTLTELLQTEHNDPDGDPARMCILLEVLERLGHAARPAVPTVLELLDFESGTLIEDDGLILQVMDALGGIGDTSDAVRNLLEGASAHPADIIQSHAKGTLWKLCFDEPS